LITESQAKALANLLHQLRPKWSVPAMLKLLANHQNHPAPFQDITAAAVSAARDPKIETPGAFLIDQRFWPAETRQLMPKPPPCQQHIGQDAHNCRSCQGDIKAGLRPPDMIGKHYEPPTEDHEAPANAGA
jgi:hypothetical protein